MLTVMRVSTSIHYKIKKYQTRILKLTARHQIDQRLQSIGSCDVNQVPVSQISTENMVGIDSVIQRVSPQDSSVSHIQSANTPAEDEIPNPQREKRRDKKVSRKDDSMEQLSHAKSVISSLESGTYASFE